MTLRHNSALAASRWALWHRAALEASRREVKEVKEEKQALAKELAAARAEVEAVRVELEAERLAAARVREDYDRHVATMIQVDALPVTCM